MSPVGTRLTDLERAERAVSERDFQRQVVELAELFGWAWCHWRPLQNRRGFWQTPVEGPLGAGWPDLTLVRVRDRRLLFVELKRQLEHPNADQAAVLAALGELAFDRYSTVPALGFGALAIPRIDVCLWRPSDLRDPIEDSVIGRCLR